MDNLLSPGISGDNPNFGLAMWNGQDNTGFYPGFQDNAVMGFMPTAPTAIPQVDLLGGGGTAFTGGMQTSHTHANPGPPAMDLLHGGGATAYAGATGISNSLPAMGPVGSGRPSMGFAPSRTTGGSAPTPMEYEF